MGKCSNLFSNITALLRNFMIASLFLLLLRLDCTCQAIKIDILVYSLNQFCTQNITAHKLIFLVWRRSNLDCTTRSEKLNFLTYGSLKLCYILEIINQYFMPLFLSDLPRTILITEKLLLSTLFIKLVIKLLYIKTAVLHARLSNAERIELVIKFNNLTNRLTVLIIMY